MAKIHWSGGSADLRIGCERKRGNRFGSILHRTWTSSVFVERATASPDHYCTHCTKAARLALAAESAPKPSDVVWPKPRPISEAPKDGSLVLVHWSRSEYPLLKDDRWCVARYNRGGVWSSESNRPLYLPTHFLPLPPEVR